MADFRVGSSQIVVLMTNVFHYMYVSNGRGEDAIICAGNDKIIILVLLMRHMIGSMGQSVDIDY